MLRRHAINPKLIAKHKPKPKMHLTVEWLFWERCEQISPHLRQGTKPVSLLGMLTRQDWLNDGCITESAPQHGSLKLCRVCRLLDRSEFPLSLPSNPYYLYSLVEGGLCESHKPQKPFETCELFTSWVMMGGLQYGNIPTWWILLQNSNKPVDEIKWIINILINWKECKQIFKRNKISRSQKSKWKT